MTRAALETALASLGWDRGEGQDRDSWTGPSGRVIHVSDRGARCAWSLGSAHASARVGFADAARFAQEAGQP